MRGGVDKLVAGGLLLQLGFHPRNDFPLVLQDEGDVDALGVGNEHHASRLGGGGGYGETVEDATGYVRSQLLA